MKRLYVFLGAITVFAFLAYFLIAPSHKRKKENQKEVEYVDLSSLRVKDLPDVDEVLKSGKRKAVLKSDITKIPTYSRIKGPDSLLKTPPLKAALRFAKKEGVDLGLRLSPNWALSLLVRWKGRLKKYKELLKGKKRGVDLKTGKIVDIDTESAYQDAKKMVIDTKKSIEALKKGFYLVLKERDKAKWNKKGHGSAWLDAELNSLLPPDWKAVLFPRAIPSISGPITLLIFKKRNPLSDQMLEDIRSARFWRRIKPLISEFNEKTKRERSQIYEEYLTIKGKLDAVYRRVHNGDKKVEKSEILALENQFRKLPYMQLFKLAHNVFDSKKILFNKK